MRSLLLQVAAIAVPTLLSAAGNGTLDRATLRGLTGLNVVVDKIDPQIESAGVTADSVRSRIEDRLRTGQVPLDPSKPEFLAVRVTGVRANRGPFAVAVTLGVYQQVNLSRDPKIRTATQTWEVETVLLADGKQLYRGAMDSIDELVASFLDAYRAANAEK